MKTRNHLLCCWLLAGSAAAQEQQLDICSPRFTGTASDSVQVEAMRKPVEQEIVTIDNARIELPSPSLASGNINYLTITPNFAGQLDKICVIGYFELRRGQQVQALPLRVEHIEVVRGGGESGQADASTRVYFRTPRVEEFANGADLRGTWKFWERHQTVHLKLAAFSYEDGIHGKAYFGRGIKLAISNKSSSIAAAALFAAMFYLIAAATIPSARPAGVSGAIWRGLFSCLKPWKITVGHGQASLSQLQMLLFTLIVATLLFYQWLRTGLLQELSTDLLYLIGISTAGAAGSQITSTLRRDLDEKSYQYAQQLGWFTAPRAGANRQATAADLVMTEQRFDIYKFQMLVFTFVIAAYVLASGADQLGNIQISTTLLALMGMSQGAYVGGRAASGSLAPLQDQLLGMRQLQERWHASDDPALREELQRRFRQIAGEAAGMFGSEFGRELPDAMLDMPAGAPPAR
jgi:hypothetical protein